MRFNEAETDAYFPLRVSSDKLPMLVAAFCLLHDSASWIFVGFTPCRIYKHRSEMFFRCLSLCTRFAARLRSAVRTRFAAVYRICCHPIFCNPEAIGKSVGMNVRRARKIWTRYWISVPIMSSDHNLLARANRGQPAKVNKGSMSRTSARKFNCDQMTPSQWEMRIQ